MTTHIRPYRTAFAVALLTLLATVALASTASAASAADTPRRGGVLLAVIGADPPSLDPHQESTFANIELVAPLYSTLLQIDPYHYPKIIGDVATDWKIAPDGLTYTFKLRQGIRFHDGSPLTSADVKASYDKIIFPPAGVRSVRKNAYTAVERVEAPDPTTVIFKLKFPSASLLDNLASPWNVIFPKKYLDKDPNYFKTNVVGSGPFKFKNYTRGSTFEGERNPDYFIKDRPYLDGYKFFISPETSVRAAAIRSGRAYIEFRNLPSAELLADGLHLGAGEIEAIKAARRQGRRPGNAHDRPVGHRREQHGQALQRRARAQGVEPRHRPLHHEQGAVPAHRTQVRGRPDAPWLGLGHVPRRAGEAARLRPRHGEEPGGRAPAPCRGRLSQRPQGRPQEPQREAALPGLRGLPHPGVAEDRGRGRAPAAGDGGVVLGRAGHGQLRADRGPRRGVHGRAGSIPGALRHGQHPELGALLRPSH